MHCTLSDVESLSVFCRLPSFTEEYTASTPLTRIRDIAHRNDIPHELKQTIKHTIQNKLHRNAGNWMLVRTMLARSRLYTVKGIRRQASLPDMPVR